MSKQNQIWKGLIWSFDFCYLFFFLVETKAVRTENFSYKNVKNAERERDVKLVGCLFSRTCVLSLTRIFSNFCRNQQPNTLKNFCWMIIFGLWIVPFIFSTILPSKWRNFISNVMLFLLTCCRMASYLRRRRRGLNYFSIFSCPPLLNMKKFILT